MEKVSVIIPTFNRFKFLLNAIESVKSQTYTNIEIIVVNDCSTEKEYYEYDWSGVIMIHLPQNTKEMFGYASPGYVRNKGIEQSTGKYIAFCDDDDIWLPHKLELQINAMNETGCKMSSTESLFGDGMYINIPYQNILSDVFYYVNFEKIWNKEFMIPNNYMICSSVIIEKEILDKINNFKEMKPPEDYDCWLRALDYTNSVFIKDPCVYYDKEHGYGRNY